VVVVIVIVIVVVRGGGVVVVVLTGAIHTGHGNFLSQLDDNSTLIITHCQSIQERER